MIPFAVHSYQNRSLPVSAQRCVNFYPEVQPEGARSKVVLHGTPGLELFATCGSSNVTGLYTFQDTLYAVSDGTLYSIDSSGTATSIGSVGTGRVSIADNGTQMVIVNGINGYVYDGTTLSQITDSAFYPSATVAFQDGYFIFERKDTGQFFISAINDGTDFDGLDYATAESAPDDTLAVWSDHREIWLFGEQTIEVWFNSGDADFPFERNNGAMIERGLGATHSVAQLDNTLCWLGDDLIVYRANGYTPTRISQFGVEAAISGYSTTSDAFAYTYADSGHTFYVLTFPTESKTWVYDASAGLWHERSYWDAAEYRHRSNCYVKCYGKHFVGDFENGNIYEMSLDTYSDNSDEIRRQANSSHIHNDGERMFHSRIEIFMESGVGLLGEDDPQAMLKWSNDGGKTWGNEHWKSMGAIGEYGKRIVWNRLGSFRQRVYSLVVSDPVKTVTIGA